MRKSAILPVMLFSFMMAATSVMYLRPTPVRGDPQSAQTAGLGVTVGVKVLGRDTRIEGGVIKENIINLAEIVDVNATTIKVKLSKLNNTSGIWSVTEFSLENFTKTQVVNHHIINASKVSDLIQLNSILYNEKFGESLKYQKNLTTNATYTTLNLTTAWGIKANGTINGTSTKFKMDMAIDKTTGILIYANDSIGNVSKIYEAIQYPGVIVPTIFGVSVGNVFEMYSRYRDGTALKTETTSSNEIRMDEKELKNERFTRSVIAYLYLNPFTNACVAVVNNSRYFNIEMTELEKKELITEAGRIIPGKPSSTIGQRLFDKNLNFTTIVNDIKLNLQQTSWNGTVTTTSSPTWIKAKCNNTDGSFGSFYIEKLPGIGGLKIYETQKFDKNGNLLKDDFQIVIKGPGVVQNFSALSVGVGSWWTIIRQFSRHENKWGLYMNGSNNYDERGVEIIKVTVSHIFGFKGEGFAVIGHLEIATPGRIEVYHEKFVPLLIYDPLDPWGSIVGMNVDNREGPPMLFPNNFAFNNYQTQIMNMFEGFPVENKHGSFTADTMMIGGFFKDNEGENKEIRVQFRKLSNGIASYFMQDESHKEQDGDKGSEYRSNEVAYLVNSSLSNCNTVSPETVFDAKPGQIFEWANSQYSRSDSKSDPSKKNYNKIAIYATLATCDNFVVLLGKRYNKNAFDTNVSYKQELYQFKDSAPLPPESQYWIVSGIRNNDLESWYMSNFYQSNLTDFATVKPSIVKILNNMMPLPSPLVESDINATGRSFSIEKTIGSEIFVFKFSVNEKGVMQDMLQGRKLSNGTWLEWSRSVLVSAPEGNSMGTEFEDPPNYVDDTPSTNTDTTDPGFSPFDIPGFPTPIFLLLTFIGIAILSKKRRI